MPTIKEKMEAAVAAFIECRNIHKAEIESIQAECASLGHVNVGSEYTKDDGSHYYICGNCRALVD